MTIMLDVSLLPKSTQDKVAQFWEESYNVLSEKNQKYIARYDIYVEFIPVGIWGTSQNISYMFHSKYEHYSYYVIVRMNKEWKCTLLHEISHILLKHCTLKNLRKKWDTKKTNNQECEAEKMTSMWYKKIVDKI
jgi:hypothetical protein